MPQPVELRHKFPVTSVKRVGLGTSTIERALQTDPDANQLSFVNGTITLWHRRQNERVDLCLQHFDSCIHFGGAGILHFYSLLDIISLCDFSSQLTIEGID